LRAKGPQIPVASIVLDIKNYSVHAISISGCIPINVPTRSTDCPDVVPTSTCRSICCAIHINVNVVNA
jgi:hypothetical protein